MDIYLNFGKKTKLPILPSSFEQQESMNNTEIDINSFGSMNLLGKRGLKRLEIQSFFPAQKYSFCRCKPKKPGVYRKRFQKAMEKNKIGQCTITGIGINFRCTIESFSFGKEDGTKDINYTISLVEYRGPERVVARGYKRKYIARKWESFYSVSRKVFGTSKYAKKIAKANKKKVSYKFKKRQEIKIPEVQL